MQREPSGRGAYGRGSLQELDGIWYGRRRRGRKRIVRPTRTRREPARLANAQAEPSRRELMAPMSAEDVRAEANAREPSHHCAIGRYGDSLGPARHRRGSERVA
jgi:hypothetical protein